MVKYMFDEITGAGAIGETEFELSLGMFWDFGTGKSGDAESSRSLLCVFYLEYVMKLLFGIVRFVS